MVLIKAIGLLIMLVVVVVVIGMVSTAVADTTQFIQELINLFNLRIIPVAGEQLCDLRINVFADLQERVLSDPVIVFDNNVRSWTWFNCFDAQAFPFASLIVFPEIDTQEFALVRINEEVVNLSVTIKDKGSAQVSKTSVKRFVIPAGIVPTPINFDGTFVLTNVPSRNYDLDILYQSESGAIRIDGLAVNEPFRSCVGAIGRSC